MNKNGMPGGPTDGGMENEQDYLKWMREYQSRKAAAPSDGSPEKESVDDLLASYFYVDAGQVDAAPDPAEEPAAEAPAPVAPSSPDTPDLPDAEAEAVVRRKPLDVVLDVLSNVIPKKGDPPLEIVRKCVFLVALIVLIGSVSYIINDMVIIPAHNQKIYSSLESMYNPDNPQPVDDKYKDFNYPPGIDDAFKNLYPLNTDLRGWITYKSNAANDFLKINYPILYSGDNEKYLTEDFYNNKNNKNGALFFDYRNRIESPEDTNKSLIIYGHNMASGQMFSGLNRFINSVYNARSAPVITMNTLYHKNQYKVFAIIMIDNAEEEARFRFNYLRTTFSDDADFLNFVNDLRARSMYDYNSVDVNADDELLVLSTCTNHNPLPDGRLAVIARRVRDGESATVDTRKIVANEDVIMPRAWYEKQGKELHPFYTDPAYQVPTVDITEPDGTPTTSGDVPTGGSTGATTAGTTTTAAGTTGTGTGTGSAPPTQGPGTGTTTAAQGGGSTTNAPDGTTAPPSGGTTTAAPSEPPTDPTDPAEPTEPTEPSEPTEPTEPTEPEEPTEPAPTEPTDTPEPPPEESSEPPAA